MLHPGSIAFLAHSSDLVPQAGGGGSFSGGGHGGGHGGGGGGDYGWAFEIAYWFFRLALEYPVLGIPLLLLLVAIVVIGARRGWWKHQERTIRRSVERRAAHASADNASRIRASDPLFDEWRFRARVQRAFRRAQDAWCAQDLEPLRPFVSDGVLERFALQIEEQQRDGWRQGMEKLEVGQLSLAHVQIGPVFETITVRIPFHAEIQRVELASGKVVPGSRLPRERFAECWSFVRRRGTRTLGGDGLLEGKCPNCAAPLALNRSARCAHCAALVRSGQFDWVLAEITQTSEWRAEDEEALPGLRAYRARDPGMSAQMLEDRASVAFWRLRAAERAGSSEPLVRVAGEALCARLADALARPSRAFPVDCAVGSVRTRGLLAGAEHDRALVEVVWDGRRSALDDGGERRVASERKLERTLLVFARPAGRETSLDEAFTTAHCRTCGAHDTGGTDPKCPYCGSPRVGGPGEWLLAETWPAVSLEAVKLRTELEQLERAPVKPSPSDRALLPKRSASELVAWSAALARCDGHVDPRERETLLALGARAGVPAARVYAWLAPNSDDGQRELPRDEGEALAWFRELVRIALADGKLPSSERRFLERAGAGLGLERRGFEHLLADTRSALYREARSARATPLETAGNDGA